MEKWGSGYSVQFYLMEYYVGTQCNYEDYSSLGKCLVKKYTNMYILSYIVHEDQQDVFFSQRRLGNIVKQKADLLLGKEQLNFFSFLLFCTIHKV